VHARRHGGVRARAGGAVVALLVAAGAVAVVVVRSSRASGPRPLRYLTATVRRGTVAETVSATGTVQPARLLDLSFGGSATASATAGSSSSSGSGGSSGAGGDGTVTAVNAKVGDRVASGEALARLDTGDADQQLAVAQAQLADAEARAALPAAASPSSASSSSTPSPRSTPTATPTPSAAEQAATTAENNLAIAQAESAVRSAREAVQATVLRAPAPGRIVAVNVVKGVAPPSDAAIEERAGALQVQADVAEQDITSVRRGERADVTLPALGAAERAVVTGMPAQASSSSSSTTGGSGTVVTFPVTLTLRHPARSVLPGMSAQVSLDVERHDHVLFVPTAAIQGADAAPTVRVLEDGTPVSRPVEIGLSTDTSTEVIVGLHAGETVITGVVNPTATATVTASGFGGLGGGGLRGVGGAGFRAGGGFRAGTGGGGAGGG
jgi:RND family efflux transporter MFP subunit